MKVLVDWTACEAHGECVVAAPDIFELNESGDKLVLLQPEPPEHMRAQALEALKICPMAALQLQD